MEGELSERIESHGSGDEFDDLAANLNAMLERMETLMDDVRRVSDNVAHDLRTPLGRLRTRLEELRDAGGDGASSALAEAALGEADQMLATFNALLRIARIETGQRRHAFERGGCRGHRGTTSRISTLRSRSRATSRSATRASRRRSMGMPT